MTTFQSFLNTLTAALRTAPLRPDAKGACLLTGGDSIPPLLFEYDDYIVPNSILLSTPVRSLSVDHQEKLLMQCLTENNTQASTLAKHPQKKTLYLYQRISADISEVHLKALIDTFTTSATKWMKELAE